VEYLLLALLVVAAVVVVGRPLLREPGPDQRLPAADPQTVERVRLREERDAALEGLRDLELDWRTGKIAAADYEALDAELRGRASAAIEALERPQ
jgi:hypothetical protein